MARYIGKHGHRSGGDDHEADRQPIETVGQVDGIRRADHYKDNEEIEEKVGQRVRPEILREWLNQQIGLELFEEWKIDRGRIRPLVRMKQQQQKPNNHRTKDLQ